MKHDLGLLFVALAVGAMVHLKYRSAKGFSEENDQKADLTTLFAGKK